MQAKDLNSAFINYMIKRKFWQMLMRQDVERKKHISAIHMMVEYIEYTYS
jgi:hypothetical protein